MASPAPAPAPAAGKRSASEPGGGVPASVPEDPFAHLPRSAVVAIAMSGGVDSSVAAARCALSGLRVMGVTLAMWSRPHAAARDRGCCTVDAVDDARRVAATLGIPHYVWNLRDDFEQTVIRDFEDAYASGRTPNPCVRCNRSIKFGALLARARAAGATHVATGHYARRGRRGATWTLHRAADLGKDQAYALHGLDQGQLAAALFPVGTTGSKNAIRAEAARLGLGVAAKPDSQELCFVDGTLRAELERRLDGRYRPGAVVDAGGRRLGTHRGLPFYTVGQRSGLGLAPGRPDASPMYVTAIDASHNTVTVGAAADLDCLAVAASACSWVSAVAPAPGLRCAAQVRSRGPAHPVVVESADRGGRLRLRLDRPLRQVAPGQSVVLYRGDEVLGGGVIDGGA